MNEETSSKPKAKPKTFTFLAPDGVAKMGKYRQITIRRKDWEKIEPFFHTPIFVTLIPLKIEGV